VLNGVEDDLQPAGDPLWERACSRWRRHVRHQCKL